MIMPTILVVACVLSTGFFIWTEYKWQQKNTIITKGISSLLFISIGLCCYISKDVPAEYALWIIAALVFGLIGDLFLVFPNIIKSFILGLVAFLIGQIIYGVTFLRFNGFMAYDVLIYAAIVGCSLLAYKRSSLQLGKMKMPVLFYLLIIAFMYTMGVSTLYKGGFNTATTVFIVAGATLFLISDILLAFVRFQPDSKPYLRGMNLALYYSGQILLALSICTFN
ncbi:MAG: lysoplasmalogenase [Eubacteriales bacterium]